ncbi:MAG: universal stress protein [Actinobacteria bacterium]|jgi:nucleotide-binding universal stress UspA family protein|nr:MAG: universal stress protein [Actinomycetota bacterium]
MTADASSYTPGPIVFAYDGSELAKLAIDEAGRLLGSGREAIIVTVWQPFDVGFVPAAGLQIDAKEIAAVRQAAEQTAAEGVSAAEAAGFRGRAMEMEATPTWKGIVKFADEYDASLIVLGSHGRTGLADALLGSVAGAVAGHTKRSVLITHRRA